MLTAAEGYFLIKDVDTLPSKTIRSADKVREGRNHRKDGSRGVSLTRSLLPIPTILTRLWRDIETSAEERDRIHHTGSGRPRQFNSRDDRHIIRHAHVVTTSTIFIFQPNVMPSLQTIIVYPYLCKAPWWRTFGIAYPLRVLPMISFYLRLCLE